MTRALVWFRQDLRCSDNVAFATACNQHSFVIPVYIHDEQTLPLGEAQQWWLHHSLLALEKKLQAYGVSLVLRKGNAADILAQLITQYQIDSVCWNRCYEPAAITRDTHIKASLKKPV